LAEKICGEGVFVFKCFFFFLCTWTSVGFAVQDDLSQVSLDAYLNAAGFFLSPEHSRKNEGYSSAAQRLEFSTELSQLTTMNTVLEIGFNAGHSSELFLNCPTVSKVLSFDLNVHPYTKVGVEFMTKKFEDRFVFVPGDSRVQLPKYAETHPKEKFDLIFIDGGHEYHCCIADIRNSRRFAHRNTLVWIDDYYPEGVQAAVDQCVKEGIITLVQTKSVVDGSGRRAWAIVRHNYYTDAEEAFTKIYQSGLWGKDAYGQGTSGPGSTVDAAWPYIALVQNFLKQATDVRSIVDIGCGDFVVGGAIQWGDSKYTGIDCCKFLIQNNQRQFGSDRIQFMQLDAVEEDLPDGDLALCKDMLMHLPNASIETILTKLSKFKYVILVNDVTSIQCNTPNQDIQVGGFRTLDLTCAPFFLTNGILWYYTANYPGGSVLKQVVVLKNQ
jgi:predicted O-methyltransferase YrrM/SAM-dependent methyltransferase